MKRDARRGVGALALVLLFASLFAITTFGVGDDVVRLLHSNSGAYLQRKANFAAYAALQRCLSELDKSTVYDGDGTRYVSSWDPGESLTDVPMPGESEVFYTVRCYNNSSGALGSDYLDPEGTRVPVGMVSLKVHTVARPTGNQRGRTYSANIASLGFVGQVHWQHALLGSNRVKLQNDSMVDAFDSREAQAYPGGTTTTGANPTFATVASNGIRSSLQLHSRSRIKGRVRWGPRGEEQLALQKDGDVLISGDCRPNDYLFRIPRFRPPYNPASALQDVVLSPGERRILQPGAYRSLVVPAGAELHLLTRPYDPTGHTHRYYFDQSVRVDGGVIELDSSQPPVANSRVELYVGEQFEVRNGGQVNVWRNHRDSRSNRLQVLFVGNGAPHSPQRLTLDGGSRLHAVVLGRGLSCTLDHGSHLFGALRAFEITLDHGSGAHWDQALRADTRIRGQVAWTLQGIFEEATDLAQLDLGVPEGSGMDYQGGDLPGGGGGGNDGGGPGGDGGSDAGNSSGDAGTSSGDAGTSSGDAGTSSGDAGNE